MGNCQNKFNLKKSNSWMHLRQAHLTGLLLSSIYSKTKTIKWKMTTISFKIACCWIFRPFTLLYKVISWPDGEKFINQETFSVWTSSYRPLSSSYRLDDIRWGEMEKKTWFRKKRAHLLVLLTKIVQGINSIFLSLVHQ